MWMRFKNQFVTGSSAHTTNTKLLFSTRTKERRNERKRLHDNNFQANSCLQNASCYNDRKINKTFVFYRNNNNEKKIWKNSYNTQVLYTNRECMSFYHRWLVKCWHGNQYKYERNDSGRYGRSDSKAFAFFSMCGKFRRNTIYYKLQVLFHQT